MVRILPTLTAVVAVIACGVVHGVWTDRWQISTEPAASAAKLKDVTRALDGWEGAPIARKDVGKGMAGHLLNRYINKRTGDAVTVFVVCDRPGEVAIHTPDICYEAAGFEVMKPAKFTAPPIEDIAPATFWTSRFHKKSAADASDLRIYWAWNAGDGWLAADDARLSFARFPVLFKLYLIHELPGGLETPGADPCVELMKQLLPELQHVLFHPS